MKILLAITDKFMNQYLINDLEKTGAEVTVCENYNEVAEALTNTPDALIIDGMLPSDEARHACRGPLYTGILIAEETAVQNPSLPILALCMQKPEAELKKNLLRCETFGFNNREAVARFMKCHFQATV